jgi:hypothetical protein
MKNIRHVSNLKWAFWLLGLIGALIEAPRNSAFALTVNQAPKSTSYPGTYTLFSSGDTVSSGYINANFDELYYELNAIIASGITGSGSLTFTAGGTNQNITLTPSGSGYTILNGSVGIGTTSPSSSALLAMQSTSKGFLPPVMTYDQKDAISSPTTGLVVFDTTNSPSSSLVTATGTGATGTATGGGGTLSVYSGVAQNGTNWVPSGPVLLQKYVAAGGETAVTFSNIPQNFNHLKVRIVCLVQSGQDNIQMKINGATSVYDHAQFYGYGGNTVSNLASNDSSLLVGSTNSVAFATPASNAAPGDITVELPYYSSTAFYKTYKSWGILVPPSTSSSQTYGSSIESGANESTAAITSLTFSPNNSGTFANGSVFFLYGEM